MSTDKCGQDTGLGNFPLFFGIETEALRRIENAGEVRHYKTGDLLLKQGGPGDFVCVLTKGVVRVFINEPVSGAEILVKLFAAPAIFGEMEALGGHRMVESVAALRHSEAHVYPGGTFNSILEEHPQVGVRLLRDVCERFYVAAQNQGYQAIASVEQRLAGLLASYARLMGVKVAGGVQIVADLTQESLAQSVAATRKSIQRTFTTWTDKGLLQRDGRSMVIRDIEVFEEIAGMDAPRYDYRLTKRICLPLS
ncbi:MAG: hypothetical protein A2289_15360 [Deltaproteobacteria bacterium RIFOXYA12_FULL_58_15]|nr:MAG: hypothetical protein A2289_15360 [Deltaproteobacteria bacterium RIFOXYA12_FULL_58_15]OGR13133.1 MAG: hypothetical protein A2341_08530 [Deltaproteobacteria bacterium RIFOXYB12_FULL_58_9]